MSKSDIAQDEERRWTQPGNEDVQIIVVEKEEEIGTLILDVIVLLCPNLLGFRAIKFVTQ